MAAHRRPPARSEVWRRIELRASEDVVVDLVLPHAARIAGMANLADGRPASGAVVVASRHGHKPPLTHPLRTTVDPDGAFVIEDLDAGALHFLWADVPGLGATVNVVAGSAAVVLKLR